LDGKSVAKNKVRLNSVMAVKRGTGKYKAGKRIPTMPEKRQTKIRDSKRGPKFRLEWGWS